MINSYLLLSDNAINNKQAALTPANAIWDDTYTALPTGYGHHVHGILDALVHPQETLLKHGYVFLGIPFGLCISINFVDLLNPSSQLGPANCNVIVLQLQQHRL
uniref:Uncharacterized protein n=1 Tax=Opuntia streptacantha TaxID=393608 RepID=A0A7C9CHC9_OPUST